MPKYLKPLSNGPHISPNIHQQLSDQMLASSVYCRINIVRNSSNTKPDIVG